MSGEPNKPAPMSCNEMHRAICENVAFGQAHGYYPGNPPVLVADDRSAAERGAIEH